MSKAKTNTQWLPRGVKNFVKPLGDHTTIQKAVGILNLTSLLARESRLLNHFRGKPAELHRGRVSPYDPGSQLLDVEGKGLAVGRYAR